MTLFPFSLMYHLFIYKCNLKSYCGKLHLKFCGSGNTFSNGKSSLSEVCQKTLHLVLHADLYSGKRKLYSEQYNTTVITV